VRKRDVARDAVRVDLSLLGPDRSRALLDRYQKLVERIARQSRLSDTEPEDLVSIGRVAVLEAAITHDAKRIPEARWVRKVVRWRIQAEAVRLHERESVEVTGTDPDPQSNGVYNQEAGVMLLRAIRAMVVLSPREHAVVDLMIRGCTFEETGRQLGITRQRVHQNYTRALEKMREHMGIGVTIT